MASRLVPRADAHVIDTNLFIVFERHDAVPLLGRVADRYGIVFSMPQRVYAELTPESLPYASPPVDDAIEFGWARVLPNLDYSNPMVSATMDTVRRYIAAAENQSEHEIDQTDAAVGGATAMLLEQDTAASVAVYTHDIVAFRGMERALAARGYQDALHLVKAFDFFERVKNHYRFSE